MFFLFQTLVHIAFSLFLLLAILVGGAGEDSALLAVAFFVLIGLWILFWLAMLVPNVAIVVRRFHDQNISGLVGILLYVGTLIFTLPGLVILVFMCLEGKKGDNQYGKDPKMNENVADIFR